MRFAFFRTPSADLWDSREPIREELFSVERLEAHARSLAAAQPVSLKQGRGRKLAARLADNGASLLLAYRAMARAIGEGRAITPAAEWLVDNYHLIEKQIREIRADLPVGYYRQLPKLAAGPFLGYPRIFGVVWAFVAHTDSHFDTAMLLRYVRAYQEVQPLTIGELWAVPVTLRIVLIENLRRVAAQMAGNRAARQVADELADRLLGVGPRGPEPAELVFARHEHVQLEDAFAVQLVHRLRDQDPRITPALTWLDRRLAAQDLSADEVVREVHRRQGASNVTVRNIITSLRLIGDVDWPVLIEQLSLVDGVLAAGSMFQGMDFPTRNLYRSAIEQLARDSGRTELDIAHAATRAAAAETGRAHDPGYHLLGAGRHVFAHGIGCASPLWRRMRQACGLRAYGGAILGVAMLLLALPLVVLGRMGLGALPLDLLACLGIIPALDAAVALVNRAVTLGFGATLLPALELRDGIPSHLRTLVAVPMLLTSPEAIEEHIERLEIHHLASPDGDLHFALLSDWTDAATESQDGDQALLAVAEAGIARLNTRYGPAPGGMRFLLLHRCRMWAESEKQWIGWERKRGKLHELNRKLRGATDTSFITAAIVPADVRYVVTLDADTRLPREAIRRLVGKMAHPLNQPRLEASTGRITEGYAVLQPRVTPSLPSGREGSLFQRIFSSLSGIDPYAAAVSDVYQDLFGEGSYAGKGIYDVNAFEAALAGRVPEGTLLSHDLFEGIFARAGLASDVEVVEGFPARYDVGALRHHRWARGDWQLLPWILGFRGRIPAIGRWKMLDNLRRTLGAPVSVLALIAGWTQLLPDALVWTGFVLATILVPALIPVVAAIPPRRTGVTAGSHVRALGGDFRLALTLSALVLTFLAHQAWLMGDAIARTLYRLAVSRRHLLEWVTAAQAATGPRLGLAGVYRHMAGALAVAVASFVAVWIAGDGTWKLALPFAVLWCVSPVVAYWISTPPPAASQVPVSARDARALRLAARRTWRFFESFVTPADHFLPPDNFQEDPRPVLAHRTSPTNIGLYFLSVASAHDFGWIGLTETVERLEATFATLARLERFRGHFYNWYDTADLRPLDPRYVSTVDSGNLAGHLIALANACRAWRTEPGRSSPLAGVADAVTIALEEAAHLRAGPRTQTVTWDQLDSALASLAVATAAGDFGALASQAVIAADIASAFANERGGEAGADMLFWVRACVRAIHSHEQDGLPDAPTSAQARLAALETVARTMALEMEFGFLLNRERLLLSIGYLVPEGVQDDNCYDLLASEARLASFFAIVKGDVPARHWFRLGRAATPVGPGAALISWSGSMFEYLMPSLVMRAPMGSLLEQTNRLIVRRQIEYGRGHKRPWGISESGYNARDLELTYQYSNFGVPGLGLKRGLGDNLVVAPYATALAAMVEPGAAAANLARLTKVGALGRHGFYEALDYTPSRVPESASVALVRAFMAHHQGMTIVAIADTLLDGVMRARFHAEPMIQATELLLQERMPRDVSSVRPSEVEENAPALVRGDEPAGGRYYNSAHQAVPVAHLLSNGRFTTMLTSAGSGYTVWGDIAVTRWREDTTRDDHGTYIFIRDTRSNDVWSAGFQPSGVEPDSYSVAFTEDRALFTRHDGTLTTAMEVLVSAEDHAEIRRIALTNNGPRSRELEITSYAELALAPQAADIAHPAFSKLFVQTEYLPATEALIATRRRRAPADPEIWAAHLAVVEDSTALGGPAFETDRARFLGRGHDIRAPIAMIDGRVLSNTSGTVLDPVFSLRKHVRIAPGATVHIAFWTLVAPSRVELLDGIDKHRDSTAFTRVTTLAWTQAQVQLHHLGISAGDAARFQQLAGHIIHAAPQLRPTSETIKRGAGAQTALWPQGISGDLPIVLLRIADAEHLEIARQLLQAHEYWRLKGLAVDLVILNERQSSYVQDLQVALETLARTSEARQRGDGVGGRVSVRRADLLPGDTLLLLPAVARAVLVAQRGSLGDQLERIAPALQVARLTARFGVVPPGARTPPLVRPVLEFANGLGGFAEEGREYVTVLEPGQSTPAPWINVIANPSFGFHVTAEGSGCTWAVNSRENQLTPWSNDPVSDRSGEALYLRDEDSGALWSPVAYPIRDPAGTYTARHGFGYSRFAHTAHGIATELLQFVALDAPVKLSRLVLHNQSGRARSLSLTAYVEWVLGPSRSAAQSFVVTELDAATGALFATNKWSNAFGARVAFLDIGGRQTEATGDRTGFIGRNGTLASPFALTGGALEGRLGAGLDPCGALRTFLLLPPGGRVEIVICLGQAENAEVARHLVAQCRTLDLDAALAEVKRHWDEVLGAVQVKTPDRAMDIMLNGWLLYQTLACRVWARAAFYQASGAYGFRDQLQDGMALAVSFPGETRAHLLRAAGRQFLEGDVQHWWLPHSGQGVRTRISDDRAWLAYAVSHYVTVSGDTAVLDEDIAFIEGQALEEGAHDCFFQPGISEQSASLFEHCALALDASLALGGHGLPLIGTGDWNDGMNRVGERGAGESVWLGWFLYATLRRFIPLAAVRGEHARAEIWQAHATSLRAALEHNAWDGLWYCRGFYDDGTKLGAAESEECKIDSIAQSWAVLSGAAAPERAVRAMASVEAELLRPSDGVALLFAPPFNKTLLDPGYIKAYPPGIRENGGQYTHAALWSVMAFATLGEGDKAAALFALLNPVNHADTRAGVHRYKDEPYVIAADVYAHDPHMGRGGWSWYTGAAGWMQRAGVESILGVRREGTHLHLDPCIPKSWPGFEVTLRYRTARYHITVENPGGVNRGIASLSLDGITAPQRPARLILCDDGLTHQIQVTLGDVEL